MIFHKVNVTEYFAWRVTCIQCDWALEPIFESLELFGAGIDEVKI